MGFIYLSEQNSYSGKNSAGSSDAPILEWEKKKKVWIQDLFYGII